MQKDSSQLMNAEHETTSFEPKKSVSLGRVAYLLFSLLAGAFCALSLVTSVLSLGWVLRFTRRNVIRSWWRRSRPSGITMSWEEFARVVEPGDSLVAPPNWVVRQGFRKAIKASREKGIGRVAKTLLKGCVGSLVSNFRMGLTSIINVWVLTLPGCLLWQFAWYDGWNNSFNKGYEQAAVGPLTGITGVILFIAAMLYVPMAQVRQAVSKDWRVFYQFKVNWRLICRAAPQLAGLAVLYSLFTLPVMIIKTVPGFLPQIHPPMAEMNASDALSWLNGYFFWTSILVFPLFILLRWVAGTIYSRVLWKEVASGGLTWNDLSAHENACLKPLIHNLPLAPERGWLTRFMLWTFTRVGNVISGILVVIVWFSLVAQIYISEFLKYNPVVGWLNQPMIQLPSNHYIPRQLKAAAREETQVPGDREELRTADPPLSESEVEPGP